MHKTTRTFWPSDLLPKDLPNARILTFGYDADVVRALDTTSSNSLRDHGKSLAHELAINKMRARAIDRPTFFVAHSLGGLVCEQVTNSYLRYAKLLIMSGSLNMPECSRDTPERAARRC
jgi:predicted alpha/beta hydrolase